MRPQACIASHSSVHTHATHAPIRHRMYDRISCYFLCRKTMKKVFVCWNENRCHGWELSLPLRVRSIHDVRSLGRHTHTLNLEDEQFSIFELTFMPFGNGTKFCGKPQFQVVNNTCLCYKLIVTQSYSIHAMRAEGRWESSWGEREQWKLPRQFIFS